MKESDYTVFEDTVTINYSHKEGEVTVYPDLIKVTIALDDGSVIGLEARGYLMSHHARTLESPAVAQAQARTQVDPGLTILSAGLALIPTDGQYEVLCHEFICQASDGTHVIVYVNAKTGQEENILLLIEDENGTLTM